jgi:protein TonB
MASVYAPWEVLPRRAVAVAGILALHVFVVYLLVTGLIRTILPVADKPLLGKVSIEARPPPQAPPRLDLSHTRVRVVVPEVPELVIPRPSAPPSLAGTQSEAGAGVHTDAAPPPPVRVLGRNQLPEAEEFYPPELRRLGVEGATYVRVCVDGAGVRQGEPRIEQSSGNARLDEGAVNVARHGHYARSVQGDAPVPNCYHFRIAFRMR